MTIHWLIAFLPLLCLNILIVSVAIEANTSLRETVSDMQPQSPAIFKDVRDEETGEVVARPRKKSTILLNKLVDALSKAIAKDKTQSSLIPDSEPMAAIAMPSVSRSHQMDGPFGVRGSDRMFWKCYFNAVSCF